MAHPPEDFSFARCRLRFAEQQYVVWIYYPHPETKTRHFQNPSLMEIIAPHIPGIAYGDHVTLAVPDAEVAIMHSNA